MNLYVIVPVYNESKLLPTLLRRLAEMRKREEFGLVLCDNNSTDGSYELARTFLESQGRPDWHLIQETQQGHRLRRPPRDRRGRYTPAAHRRGCPASAGLGRPLSSGV